VRIAFVVTQFPPVITAGLGRYAQEITPHLADRHRLTVLTINDGRQPVQERRGTITVYRPLGRILGAILRRRRPNTRAEFVALGVNIVVSNWRHFVRLMRERPDLVVVHDATNVVCGLLCHYILRLPVVFHVHTTEHGVAPQRGIVALPGVIAAAERWLGRIARRIVVATPEMRQQLTAAGWDGAAIDVVPLGGTFERTLADPAFDRDRLRVGAADLKVRLGIPAEDPVLLFVGRLVRHKGIYQLLEAMRQIVAAVPRLRLVVVGEGDNAGVQRIVADTGLGERVLTSGGFVDGWALLEYYEMADACVFPSTFEPFGLVATEAMALSKPTILGDGFSRIFLGHPERPAVRFVRGSDPDDIARAVIAVMTDGDLRATLAAVGRRHVQKLSWARVADETLAVYVSSVAGAAGPRGTSLTA
jgi:glycosyltransferase involved in cell wall biosynthesis